MSPLWLLLTLLVVAYFGSILVGGRTIRGFGLPSGVEWLLVGFACGPQALGIFDGSTIREFQPLAMVALAWVALVIGLDYGYVGSRRIAVGGLLLGAGLALLCLASVAGLVFLYLWHFTDLSPREAALTASTVATVSCETTRQAVRWVSERYGADGPLARCFADIADGEDIVPILAISVVIAFSPRPETIVVLPGAGWVGVTLALGVVFGLLGALLIRRSLAHGESWGVLLGVALLATGVTAQLGLATVAALFWLGMTLAIFSRQDTGLRQSLQPTERPVLLPVLLLAGGSIEFGSADRSTWLLVLIAVGTRVLIKLVSGPLVAISVPAARSAPLSVGIALLPAGNLTMCIALSCYMALPASMGRLALLTAVAIVLLGELLGPAALRRSLRSAGELHEPEQPTLDTQAVQEPA